MENAKVAKVVNGKVIDGNGKDVTNQVKSAVLEAAVLTNETVMWMNEKNVWKRERLLSGKVTEEVRMYLAQCTQINEVEEKVINNPIMNLVHASMDKKPKELFCSSLKWKYLVRSAARAKNIMLTGAAGTGKTYTAQKLAEGLERPFFSFNLGATQDPRATLIGTTQFKEGEGTMFNQSLFVQAIQTENATILLDELSRANPEAANILMPVLDEGQRYLRLDEQEGAPTIKVAKGVNFVATANIGNEYTGTRVMDRALIDRFTIIEVDPLDEQTEKELLLMNFPELHDKFAQAIAEIGELTRAEMKTEDPRISTGLSTRSTLEMAGLVYDGFKLSEAAEVAIYPFYDNEGGMDSERTFIKQIVQKFSHLDEVSNETVEDVEVGDDDLFNIIDDTY